MITRLYNISVHAAKANSFTRSEITQNKNAFQ